ncbi:2'-5' RNA ligase family protein [Streptomyces sp. NPDC054796]
MAPEPELLVPDSRAFPVTPPADLDDHVGIVDHDWRAFSSIGRMSNHWDRPDWPSSRRAYYWMLTFPAAPHLIACAWRCQKTLADLGMDPVPDDGLHVTLTRIGECGDLTAPDLDRLVRRTELASLPRFELLAHPLAGSRGALRFSLSPWTPLVRLHASLTAASEDTGMPGGKPTALHRPHLGIAYNNCDRPAGPVIEAVNALRTLPPVLLDVTAVDLVELRREKSAYRWETVHRLPLR